ncbi:MAG TPA: ABC transporter permease [Gemmataceae bacterium]|nr:ABC transporter permease [Gemmataceae bacterium]
MGLMQLPVRVVFYLEGRVPAQVARLVGVLVMLLLLWVALLVRIPFSKALDIHQSIAQDAGLYGLPTVGVGVLIISGGIDLSIGSVVGLGAVCFGLMVEKQVSPWTAALVVLAGSALIGVAHGLLVTRLRLQPFLVTLCGLFIYRGLAKWLAPDHSPGLNVADTPDAFQRQVDSFKQLLVGDVFGVPNQLLWLLGTAVLVGLFLHGTRHGRYLFAIGANEEAAHYAGIRTDRYKVFAYILCSVLAGLDSLVFVTYNNTVNPTSGGSWWELYAITGAVLGGCSLRGGEGSVAGMVLGAAVLPVLRQLCYTYGIKSELEYAVIGGALLVGTIVDVLLKRGRGRS